MKDIQIRPIQSKDNKIIQKIIQNILEKHALDFPGTAYSDPYLGQLTEYYANIERAEYWVLTYNGKVIGGIGIAPFNEEEEVAELQKFYLDESFQGQGYGGKLFQKAKQYAVDQNYQQLYIETTDVLGKANIIYEHYGFEKLDRPLSGSEHAAMNIWYLYDLKK